MSHLRFESALFKNNVRGFKILGNLLTQSDKDEQIDSVYIKKTYDTKLPSHDCRSVNPYSDTTKKEGNVEA